MEILEVILIAKAAINFGDEVISKLEGFGKEVITREEFEELFNIPDFSTFSKRATERKTNDE